jgi:F-type H+-transporting ATPase subunit alpha
MSVPEQLVVLLALKNELFDTVPIEKMKDAENTLLKTVTELSNELVNRLLSNKELSSEDDAILLNIARDVLAPFQENIAH